MAQFYSPSCNWPPKARHSRHLHFGRPVIRCPSPHLSPFSPHSLGGAPPAADPEGTLTRPFDQRPPPSHFLSSSFRFPIHRASRGGARWPPLCELQPWLAGPLGWTTGPGHQRPTPATGLLTGPLPDSLLSGLWDEQRPSLATNSPGGFSLPQQ